MSRLVVSSSPHYRCGDSTASLMRDVAIALSPAAVGSVVFFGPRALMIILVSVAACLAFESLFNKITRRPNTVSDGSAVVTGILLAFNLPVTAPYWMVTVGAFFAVIVVKMLFGGLGKNFLNPALASRAFLFSFPSIMSTFTEPFSDLYWKASFIFGEPMMTNGVISPEIDAITGATALKSLKTGVIPGRSLTDLLIGNTPGCLGETSAILLLLGLVYLLVRRVITWHIPVCYLGTVAVLTYLFPLGGADSLRFTAYELLSGGLILGATFMATDYATSPLSRRGRVIYGIGCGVLTVVLRYYGSYAESVSYSILIMNVVTLAIDRYLKPRRYGTGGDRV